MSPVPAPGVLTSLTEWAQGTLPLFQLLAAVATAVAAIAAWRSASAARFTARRADETTRRATEALGRSKEPVLRVDLLAEDEVSRDETPMVLRVRTTAPTQPPTSRSSWSGRTGGKSPVSSRSRP